MRRTGRQVRLGPQKGRGQVTLTDEEGRWMGVVHRWREQVRLTGMQVWLAGGAILMAKLRKRQPKRSSFERAPRWVSSV